MVNDQEEKDPWTRDENGEIVHAKLTPEQNEKIRMSQYLYVFKEWYQDNKKEGYSRFLPVYDVLKDKNFWAFPQLKVKHYTVFKSPEKPPYDEWIKYTKHYEALLNKYFTETLTYSPIEEETGLKFEKCNLVLPLETFDKVVELTKEFKIEEHFDFILYLISAIQHMYTENIQYSEVPEEVNRIKNFPKQTKTLIQILEHTEDKHGWDWQKNGYPPQLSEIVFRFKYNKPKFYTISDNHHVSYIADAIKAYFNDGIYKNWKLRLEAFPNIYSENEKNRQYRYRISKALHNYFIEEKIFSLTKKNHPPDDEVRCIAKILELAHIYATNKKGDRISAYIDNDVVKIVKHWIDRKEKLEHTERLLEAAPLNKELLYKYFDKNLIDSVNTVYDTKELSFVWTLCERFNIEYLMPGLAHLFKILTCQNINWLFQSHELENKEQISPEFFQFNKLVNAYKKDGSNTASIKFTQADNSEIKISSSLLKDLITKAIVEYHENNPADFKIDLLKKVDDKILLKEPHERFLSQFCLSCHNFLKGEVKLTVHDLRPTKNYFTIIGLLLQRSWVFNHQRHAEDYLVKKVGEWISIAKAGPAGKT